MARLEFEFVSIGANGVDNDINKINNNFKGLHGTLEQNIKDNLNLSNQLKEVSQKLKESGNSSAEFSQAQRELRQKVNDSNAIIRQQINAFDKTDGSLSQMRSSLSLANRAFDNLSKTAREGSIGNNLSKQIATLTQEISKAEQATGRFQRNVGNYQQAQSGANGVAMEFNRIIQDAPFGMMGIGNNIQQLAANWQTYTQQAKAAAVTNGTTVTTMGLMKGALSALISPANLLTLGVAAITSAITFMSMNSKKASEDVKTLNNSFTQQASVLENLIFLTSQQANTERDKATAISLYNKELGDTLGKVKTYAELESKLIKSGSDYIKYLQAKGLAEASYQKILQQTGMMMDSIQSLSSKGSVDIWGKITKFGRDFKKTIGIDINDGLKDAITMQEQVKILMMEPWQAEKEIKKYTFAIRQGLYEIRGSQAGQSEMRQFWADMTKSSNAYADAIGGIKMPDLNLDKATKNTTKNLGEVFDYLSKIKDFLGDKQKDLDMFGLKGEAKELKELENSYKDFFSELEKLSTKLSKDKNIGKALKESLQGQIANAKALGESLQEKQSGEITNKWLKERTELIDEMYSKIEGIGLSGLDKALADWTKQVDNFKNKILETGVPLAQFESTIKELTEKGELKIKVDFAIKDLEEIDKLEKSVQDIIDKPFRNSNKNSVQKQLDERIKILKEAYDKLVDAMREKGIKVSDEQYQQGLDKVINSVKTNATVTVNLKEAEQDLKDYVSIANNGLNSVFTNLKSNIDEFGLKARSVFYTLGESVSGLIDQIKEKNMGKFMKELTKTNEEGITNIAQNWKEMNKDLKISAGLGYAGGVVQSFGGAAGNIIGGGLSGAAAGLSAGAATGAAGGGPWGAAIGAVVGMTAGILKQAKNRRQEKYLIKQIEEQKKANRLLERMSALTYASQIIGQKTEYGIISGVRRNEFGQIVSVVQGQDIIMVADRTNSQKNR